uniref:Uncharacterized protein n=1 Tax=Arundo donax TaxID=35708 RepID=A0A0A9BA66_ARUDO
MPCEFTRLLS